MEVILKENERIDDLELNDLKIIQNKNGFCFGIDSVLLSDFAKDIRNDSTVLDLGTGTGILGILLSEKTKLSKIYGIEIQKDVADMANRSIVLNHLEDIQKTISAGIEIDFISIDLRSALELLSELTGESVTEDVIDEIFSKFCIGK